MKTHMKTQKSPLQAARDEFEKAADLVTVWLILKNGEIAGRITARSGRNNILHLAFSLYAKEFGQNGIFGYRRMTGMGYPKIDEGVADILCQNAARLRKEYHVSLHSWSLPDCWRRDFENRGYSVLRAL